MLLLFVSLTELFGLTETETLLVPIGIVQFIEIKLLVCKFIEVLIFPISVVPFLKVVIKLPEFNPPKLVIFV